VHVREEVEVRLKALLAEPLLIRECLVTLAPIQTPASGPTTAAVSLSHAISRTIQSKIAPSAVAQGYSWFSLSA
jgi:hypothetical protein